MFTVVMNAIASNICWEYPQHILLAILLLEVLFCEELERNICWK